MQHIFRSVRTNIPPYQYQGADNAVSGRQLRTVYISIGDIQAMLEPSKKSLRIGAAYHIVGGGGSSIPRASTHSSKSDEFKVFTVLSREIISNPLTMGASATGEFKSH